MNSKLFLVAVFYLFFGLLAAVLQTSLFPRLGLAALTPGLSYIMIVSLPTVFPVWMGTLLAIALGMITDTIFLAGSGFHAFSFLILFYLMVYLRQTIFFDRLPYQALMAGLAQLVLFLGVQLGIAGPETAGQGLNLIPGLSSALATGLAAVPVLYALRPLGRLTHQGIKKLAPSP